MTPEEQKQELNKLEKDPKFKQLCEMLEGDNLLSFFEIEKQETKHSRALAKLFTPQGYCWGGEFIEYLVKTAGLIIQTNIDYTSFDVETEYVIPSTDKKRRFIDILLYSDDAQIVIVIENKIDSGEHSNQLQKYYEWIEKDPKFTGYQKYYIFLTKTGERPKGNEDKKIWKVFSYKDVIKMLDEIVPNLANCSLNMESILKQYKQYIRRNIVVDKALADLYVKLYNEYPNALNGLTEYITSKISMANRVVADEIRRVLKELETKKVIYNLKESQGGVGNKGGTKFTFQTTNLQTKLGSITNPVIYTIMPETSVASVKIDDNYYVCFGDIYEKDDNIKSKICTAFDKKLGKNTRIMSQRKEDEAIYLKDNYSVQKGNLKKTTNVERKIGDFLKRAEKYENKIT